MSTQFVPEFEAECKKSASSEGVTLPPQFSVQRLFEEVTAALKINKPMLEAAVRLQDSGEDWVLEAGGAKLIMYYPYIL